MSDNVFFGLSSGAALIMWKVIALVLLNICFWVLNSVSFWWMGRKMPNYPIFATWFSTIPYIGLWFLRLVYSPPPRNNARIALHLICIVYTALSVFDTMLEMISNSHVSGLVQSIESAAIPLPVTGFLAWMCFKHHFGLFEIIGSLIAFGGAAFTIGGETAGIGTDIWWMMLFGCGLIVGCIYTIIWEHGFRRYHLDPITILQWSTLYTWVFYLACIPVTLVPGVLPVPINASQVWTHQLDGLKCFFQVAPLPPGCEEGAWIPLVINALSSVATDLVQLYLVRLDSAFFLILADTVTLPITIAIFSSKSLFGSFAEPFTWRTGVAIGLTVLGMIIYKANELRQNLCRRRGAGGGELIQTVEP